MKKVSIITAEEAALKVQDGDTTCYRRFSYPVLAPENPFQGSREAFS